MTNNDPTQLPPDIVTLPKKGKFLTAVDALPIGKVKFVLTTYDDTTKQAKSSSEAYLDIDRARVLCHQLKQTFVQKTNIFTRFGGGMSNGELQSRVIKVDFDTADGKFNTIPWRFEVSVGPGKYTGTGGIEPAGAAHAEFVRLSTEEALLLALTLEAYFAAKAEYIFNQRFEYQQGKRQKRFDKKGGTSGFSIRPTHDVIPVKWRGFAAGTPLTALDTESLKILSQNTEKAPALAQAAKGILFERNV